MKYVLEGREIIASRESTLSHGPLLTRQLQGYSDYVGVS